MHDDIPQGPASPCAQLDAEPDDAYRLFEAYASLPPGRRDLRPVGSSLWMRWPEFGFGLDKILNKEMSFAEDEGLHRWSPWRGSRSERDWPEAFMHGATWPWQAASLDEAEAAAPVAPITIPAPTAAQFIDDPEWSGDRWIIR